MSSQKTIGIIGGVGPYAGLDLNKKVFDHTVSSTDQDHLSVFLFSSPSEVPDRTKFLLDSTIMNPAEGLFNIVSRMERAGVEIAAVACNTAHSPKIFDVLEKKLKESGSKTELVHMVNEIASFIVSEISGVKKAGILATDGTISSGVYDHYLGLSGIETVYPDTPVQKEFVHRAIYDLRYGIKAVSSPVTAEAVDMLKTAIKHLVDKGAEAVVLGCTELPLAITEHCLFSRPVVDTNMVLARALVRKAAPGKLKPLPFSYKLNNANGKRCL